VGGKIRKEDVFVDLTTFGYCPKTNLRDEFLTTSYKALYSNQRNIILPFSRVYACTTLDGIEMSWFRLQLLRLQEAARVISVRPSVRQAVWLLAIRLLKT